MDWSYKLNTLSMEWSYGLYRIREIAQIKSDQYMIAIFINNHQIYTRTSPYKLNKESLKSELIYFFKKNDIKYEE